MATSEEWILQAAAIPLRRGRICLVTSSSGKRWVIPKGCLEPGKSTAEIALQEAWEEAGVTGVLRPDPVGSYHYEKFGGTCQVTVFVLDVQEAAEDWPEKMVRERAWLTVKQALERLDEAGLRKLVAALQVE